MRQIGKFLEYKKITPKKSIDQESVFYILKSVIKVKYGDMGILNLKPEYFKDGVIFIKAGNSNWANELWLNRKILIDEINKKIGEDEILEIKIK